METTKSEVEIFLVQAKGLILQKRVVFVPRDVNVQGLVDLGIDEAKAWVEIARLTINNYCQGPESDRDGSATFVWVFGATVEKTATYIKLKIEPSGKSHVLKCLSFHPGQFPMRFPLRP